MPSLSMPDAIVLCGGAGTRLRSVTGNAPKSMASVGGRPFLELLLRQLRRYGFHRAVLAVGYRKDVISSSLGIQAFGLQLAYAPEELPLGTGGAMRNAADHVESNSALVMNGDSYTDVNLSKFVEDHQRTNADLSAVVVPADGRGDIGSVRVDAEGRIESFAEKQSGINSKYFINAGIYMVSRRLLHEIQPGVAVSLEKELFPQWLASGKHIRAFHHAGNCVDIGTPERYEIAQRMLASVEAEPVPPR